MGKVHIKEKGITLISLVITIIILLILAGITISQLIGNGLLEKAKLAKEKSQISELIEKVKMDIFEIQSDSEGNITKEELKEILDKYFINVPEAITDEIFNLQLEAANEYGGYKIKISDIYNGNLSDEIKKVYKLAKDVLIINPDAEESAVKSPYVSYNGRLCRVLYDANSEYGLQIITDNNIDSGNLGSGDKDVSAADFNYTGPDTIDDSFRISAVSYNKIVETLNNRAKKYMDNKGIAEKARAMGCSPVFDEQDTVGMYSSGTTHTFMESREYNGLFKVGDFKYEKDVSQVYKLGINLTGDNTRLASRVLVDWYSGVIGFGSRTVLPSDNDVGYEISYSGNCHVYDEAPDKFASVNLHGKIRPIFLISDNAKIIDGKGTKEEPYILEK